MALFNSLVKIGASLVSDGNEEIIEGVGYTKRVRMSFLFVRYCRWGGSGSGFGGND